MSEAANKALENHKNGYNCAQAVACAFSSRFGKDEREVFQLMEAFGFGMGTMGICGAVSAMAAVVGMNVSDGNIESPSTKKASYKAMKELTEKFIAKNRSVICREIKGVDSGEMLRSCNGCISDAAELLEDYLNKNKGE